MSSKIFGKGQRLNTNARDETLIVETNENYIYVATDYGLDTLRNDLIQENGGTVSNPVGQYYFSCQTSSANVNGRAGLSTKQLARFELGGQALCYFGLFNLVPPTLNSKFMLGLVDKDITDGWYFMVDSSGLTVNSIVNGVVVNSIAQADFNTDKLDGNGPSGLTWSSVGPFTYAIKITAQIFDISFGFLIGGIFYTAHQYGITTFADLQRYTQRPLTFILDNNGSAVDLNAAYLIGQEILTSPLLTTIRITPVMTAGVATTAVNATNYTPVLSIRRKSTYPNITLNLQSVDTIQDANCIFVLILNSALNTPSWGDIVETDPNNTGLEYDQAATTMTLSGTPDDGIVKVYSFLVAGAGGSNNQARTSDLTSFKLTLGLNDTMTLGCKTLSGNGNVKAILRVSELW